MSSACPDDVPWLLQPVTWTRHGVMRCDGQLNRSQLGVVILLRFRVVDAAQYTNIRVHIVSYFLVLHYLFTVKIRDSKSLVFGQHLDLQLL